MNTTTTKSLMLIPLLCIPLSAMGLSLTPDVEPQQTESVKADVAQAPNFEDAPVAKGDPDELLDKLNAADRETTQRHPVPPFFSKQVKRAKGNNNS